VALPMTKSAIAIAREAYTVAQASIPAYGSVRSRKTYTQHQLFAILVLRQFLKTDYRGIVQILQDWSDLREALEIRQVPHYSTLCYVAQKLLKKGASTDSFRPSSTAHASAA
jgi:hypothetical protein